MNVHAKIAARSTVADVRIAAHAVEQAALALQYTPRFPQCAEVLQSREESYQHALDDLREVLANV